MNWWELPRRPEPEVMDDAEEVEAYASPAAQAWLDRVDDTFVEHALRLVAGRPAGTALDVGCGPGQIVLKLAQRLPGWHFIGVDRAANMLRQAEVALRKTVGAQHACPEHSRRAAPDLLPRVQFLRADGNRLPFPDASFDLVTSNSVLHHLAEPLRVLAEIARVAKPGAAILLRDLRRPSRLAFPLHVRWYGRHYSGLMYKLYCDSVRSAYTAAELGALLARSPLGAAADGAAPASVFLHGRTHLGIECPASR